MKLCRTLWRLKRCGLNHIFYTANAFREHDYIGCVWKTRIQALSPTRTINFEHRIESNFTLVLILNYIKKLQLVKHTTTNLFIGTTTFLLEVSTWAREITIQILRLAKIIFKGGDISRTFKKSKIFFFAQIDWKTIQKYNPNVLLEFYWFYWNIFFHVQKLWGSFSRN